MVVANHLNSAPFKIPPYILNQCHVTYIIAIQVQNGNNISSPLRLFHHVAN